MLIGAISFHIVPLGMFCVEPAKMRYVHNLENRGSTFPSKEEKYDTETEKEKRRSCRSFNFSIFRNFHVIIVCISTVVYCMTVSSHYAYSGALVQQNGLTEQQASYLLSLSGITDIMGNILLGLFFDLPPIKRKSTLFFCLLNLLFSACVLILPFLKSFTLLSVVFGLWGVFATVNTFKNILLSDNVPRNQFAYSVGISLVAMAIGNASGPIITGKENIMAFPFKLNKIQCNNSS